MVARDYKHGRAQFKERRTMERGDSARLRPIAPRGDEEARVADGSARAAD
ncbi:MAG: hypothetical protein ACJAVS_002595 [Paracoccaceae bacterium]|jgi:hypothetical protein